MLEKPPTGDTLEGFLDYRGTFSEYRGRVQDLLGGLVLEEHALVEVGSYRKPFSISNSLAMKFTARMLYCCTLCRKLHR